MGGCPRGPLGPLPPRGAPWVGSVWPGRRLSWKISVLTSGLPFSAGFGWVAPRVSPCESYVLVPLPCSFPSGLDPPKKITSVIFGLLLETSRGSYFLRGLTFGFSLTEAQEKYPFSGFRKTLNFLWHLRHVLMDENLPCFFWVSTHQKF